MIEAAKAFLKRHWPALRLRTILLGVLLFTAATPGLAAVFLRVYENTLVRQTEAELIAQSAALAAAAEALWPGAPAPGPLAEGPERRRPEPATVDLSSTPVLPPLPAPHLAPSGAAPDPTAAEAARRLRPVFDRTDRTTLASIVLLDGRGRLVEGPERGRTLSHAAEVAAALAGRSAVILRTDADYAPRYRFEWLSRASGLLIHHARPVTVRGEVVGVLLLTRSPRALFKGIYQDRWRIGFGVLVIFGLLIVLSGLISRGVTRPVEALSRATREVAAGRGEVPETPATAAVEIRALYEDFRRMAEAVARRSNYLRDFAAAVSHEFKTPLAGIGGAVELLEDHGAEMSEAERRRFLANIAADNRRLSQLVTRLLDLARADMARPDAEAATALSAVLAPLADAFRERGLAVRCRLQPDVPRAAAPAATLETVLTTLLENSRQAGAREVEITAARDGDRLVLAVKDDGTGIPAGDRERLFEPFFTSRRAQGGTGLGLPIARSLLAASGGALNLGASDVGAMFVIDLPAAA